MCADTREGVSYTIHKCDVRGKVVLSYSGERIAQDSRSVCIRALFQRERMDLGYVVLKPGDVFTEWFYTDRWYNIFQIEDVDTHRLKGYYCNLTRPARIEQFAVYADDLELDVFVYPDGRTLLLDLDDYQQLPLSAQEREQVQQALDEIHELVRRNAGPFERIGSR